MKAAKALKEKGETPEELLRSIKENEAAVAEAQRVVDAWKAIVGEKARREEAAKAEAERVAAEKAEAERKVAEERERAEAEEEARVEAERKAEEERIAKQKAEEKAEEAESDKEEAEKRMDDEEPKPVGSGVFGNIYNQFKGKVKEAFDFLMKHKGGDLLGVFHRKDVGDIDLVWGDENGGLAHILHKHVGEGKSFANVDEAMSHIQNIIETGKNDFEDGDKIVFRKGAELVTVRKNFREGGKKIADKNWVLTAYDKEAADNGNRVTTKVIEGKATPHTASIDKGSKKVEKKQKKQSVFDKAKEIADKEEKKRKAEADKPKQKPLTEAERKDAEEVAGALGYRVEWVDTMEENGTIDADKKVIRIAKDAENPLVQVLGHEVAHGVRRMIGGKFRALQKAAMEVVGEKEWNERIGKKRKLNAYAEGKLAEEVTCDIVGEALNNNDALKRLAESLRGEKGILARLRDAVVRMVEYFKNRGDKEGVRRMKAADKLLAEFESALKEGVAPEQVKPEGIERSVRESRSEKTELTAEERELRDNLVERMRKGGLDVVTDSEEMQRVIDTENERTRMMGAGSVREHRVYHGSGADFDAFDHSHMGEGEGAQAYGWGTYVTEVEGIGKTYANATAHNYNNALRPLERKKDSILTSLRINGSELDKARAGLRNAVRFKTKENYEEFLRRREEIEEKYGKHSTQYDDYLWNSPYAAAVRAIEHYENEIKERETELHSLQKDLEETRKQIDELPKEFPRHLYTVEIPDDNGSNYLDWNGHPAESLLKDVGSFLEGEGFERVQDNPARYEKGESTVVLNPNATGADLYAELREALGSDKKASQALAELGCIGIKYPADNMRGGRKDGAKNYVIFNENDAKITDHTRFLRTADGEVYGLVKDGRIYLDPKVATAETAVHEYTHLWGDMLRRKDSEQWSHTVKELKNSVLWEEVKELYPELKTDDEIADEVLSTFSGRRGAERLREEARRVADGEGGVFTKAKAIETLERVKEAIARFWEGVARMFGINRYRSAEELADMAMKDLLDGVDPRKMGNNEKGIGFSAKQKRALETVTMADKSTNKATAISSADGAKVQNNLEILAESYNNRSNKTKGFITDLSQALNLEQHEASHYGTFETQKGKLVTIRVSNHNARVSLFDKNGENDGISIVISNHKNKGLLNDGNAHIIEFFYPKQSLQRADGKPLSDIIRSVSEVLYSGEFKDTTGLAERQEVNGDDVIRFQFIGEKGAAEADHAEEVFANENVERSVRESRSEKTELTAEERELRDNLVERMRKGGLDVVTDSEEMQRVIDTENERTRMMGAGSVREHRVYHGSGADFDAFDHSHMGDGEGAQAYGWGTYVTEVEGIGRTYAIQNTTKHNDALRALQHDVDAISDQLNRQRDDLKYDEEQLKRANEWRAEAELDYELFKDEAEELKEKYGESSPKYRNHLFNDIYTDEMKRAQSSVKSTEESIQYRKEKISELEKALKDKQAEIDELPKEFPRHLYTVEIPDDNGSNYLDWNGHPAESLLKDVGSFLEGEGFERVQDNPARYEKGESTVVLNPNATGADLYAELREALGSDKKASQALAELGCIGIKYPADNMRGGRKDGAKNYVIFNENDAKITDHTRFLRTADGEVYGLVKDGRIYLDPKVATAETAVHEYTHLWGDMLRRKDSEQWSHTVKELKNSVLWEEVKELYPELKTDDEIADEVLSTFSGRRGAERLREEARRVADGEGGVFTKAKAIETLERVKEAIARFWEGVARMFGINRYRSAEELADMAMKDLLDSKNPMKDESGMRKRGEVGETLATSGTYFSGGGLLEAGLKGVIDPKVAVEFSEKIAGVYADNHGNHIVVADVRDVDPKKLVGAVDGGEVQYFHASPVCKNFSKAKREGGEVELDKETALSTAEFIAKTRPKVVTIENVKGYRNSEALKIITDELTRQGYDWDADVYNAADYGGYTKRERLIVRAKRDGKLPPKPEKLPEELRKKGWYSAVEDLIPHLEEKKTGVPQGTDERLKNSGIDYRTIDKPLYVFGRGYANKTVGHAFADELLPTLTTGGGDIIIMPDGRVLKASPRVLARVTGLPDTYKMPETDQLSHTIVGNGIPTQLTEGVIAPLLDNAIPSAERATKRESVFDVADRVSQNLEERTRAMAERIAEQPVEEINNRFNEELEKYQNNELPKGHRFELGMPSAELQSAGFPTLPISMRSSLLAKKAGAERHPFAPTDLRDLVNAIQKPIAIFNYSKNNMRNLIVDVSRGGKHFLVGVTLNYKADNIEINSVSGLFPKENHEWIKWIQDGKVLRIDQKEKVQDLINSLRTNPAESERIGLNLDDVAKKVKDFENPKLFGEEIIDDGKKGSDSTDRSVRENPKNEDKPRYSRKPGESIFDYASRVSEDVDRSVRERVSARGEYEKKVKSKGFQTKEALQNSMLGLQEFMSAIDHASGNKRYIEDIPDFENPILGENRLSSVNKEESHSRLDAVHSPTPTKGVRKPYLRSYTMIYMPLADIFFPRMYQAPDGFMAVRIQHMEFVIQTDETEFFL